MISIPCLKKVDLFHFKDKFGKFRTVFIMFSVLNSDKIRGGSRNKNYSRPLVKSIAVLYLAKSNCHLYSFTEHLVQYKVTQRCLITVNVHEECYFFVFLHRLISVTCSKCPPLAHNACFEP